MKHLQKLMLHLALCGALVGCVPTAASSLPADSSTPANAVVPGPAPAAVAQMTATPFPTRPPYGPGELVDYTAQTGDTVPALAVRFNTSVDEIMAANPIIPADVTTLPSGMPMKMPIYFAPFWGTPYQSIPDSLFVNGPAQLGFDPVAFAADYPGWLNTHIEYVEAANRNGPEIVGLVARNFGVSPRLLLALLEYQSGALTQPVSSEETKLYPLGYEDWQHEGVYLQLVWAANTLNNGYYRYRMGELTQIDILGDRQERPDPWQNAASVALHYYFAKLLPQDQFEHAIGPSGLAQTYRELFGDPWQNNQAHIPGSLHQPDFILPFEPGPMWALTGGPHAGWGRDDPLAALDFAPPSIQGGCASSREWVTAVASGLVTRSEPGLVMLDLDKDGDERTGWVVLYLHIGSQERISAGTTVQQGERIGHPSCEGGSATGTHVHIARKYNGEWIPAEGALAFNLSGWIAHNGSQPYLGTLTRFSRTVTACTCSDGASQLRLETLPSTSTGTRP